MPIGVRKLKPKKGDKGETTSVQAKDKGKAPTITIKSEFGPLSASSISQDEALQLVTTTGCGPGILFQVPLPNDTPK